MAFKKKDDFKPLDDENPYSSIPASKDDKFAPVEPQKRFNLFPTKKKRFIREEALALRKCFMIMFPLHFIMLFVFDFYVYGIEFIAILVDFCLLYLDYLNYMSLNKMFLYLQIGIMSMSSFIALTHFQRVFLRDHFDWLVIFSYILQYFIVNPACAFYTFKKIQIHIEKLQEIKTEEMRKTTKGRIKLTVGKKIYEKE